jgi:hypothetical protein
MSTTGTVTIYRSYYLTDSIYDGSVAYHRIDKEEHESVHASEAARLLSDAGLSFAATGNTWAADPDGSYTANYATGEECETSGHLEGFAPRLHAAIAEKVG